jgi:hypothetical protein
LYWLALGLALLACNFPLAQPVATAIPTSAQTPTAAPATAPSPDAAPAPTVPPDWQAFEGDGVALHYPESWQRLPELEPSSNPDVPDATLVIAAASGEAQLSLRCMSTETFADTFGGTPTSPSEAGELLWDLMLIYFINSDQLDDLATELLESFTIGGLRAVQIHFTSPGFEESLGIENPIELGKPETIFHKTLAIVMQAETVCYFVVTATSSQARAQPEIADIIGSLRFTE